MGVHLRSSHGNGDGWGLHRCGHRICVLAERRCLQWPTRWGRCYHRRWSSAELSIHGIAGPPRRLGQPWEKNKRKTSSLSMRSKVFFFSTWFFQVRASYIQIYRVRERTKTTLGREEEDSHKWKWFTKYSTTFSCPTSWELVIEDLMTKNFKSFSLWDASQRRRIYSRSFILAILWVDTYLSI